MAQSAKTPKIEIWDRLPDNMPRVKSWVCSSCGRGFATEKDFGQPNICPYCAHQP